VTALDAVAAALGPRAEADAPLGALTTYRVGGPAALLARVEDEGSLVAVARAVAGTGIEVLVVGKGSNLLVADAGFAGLAVVLGEAFATIEVAGPTVRAGGAAALPVVARRTVAAGLTGFEWAVGVPGSIGGGVRMNAGGHGSDLAASLRSIRLVDLRTGEDGRVPATALELGYRRSRVAAHQVVVEAELGLAEGDPEAGARALSEIVAWRRDHQPGGPNAGSVFTNPPGDSAGRLVEAVGAKGLRVGTAQVSDKHANFIQADDGGRADDVVALMVEVRRRVREATGVDLHPETRLAGFPPTLDLGVDLGSDQGLDLNHEGEVEG
jgi:UDP-N-acetylmuramate dehydrogenase